MLLLDCCEVVYFCLQGVNNPSSLEQSNTLNGVAQKRLSNVPKHLVSQSSLASVYDNQPSSPMNNHVMAIPPEDYQSMSALQSDVAVKPRTNVQMRGSRKASRSSVGSNNAANESYSRRSRSSAGEEVKPMNGSPHPGRQTNFADPARQAAATLSAEYLRQKSSSEGGARHSQPPRNSDGVASDLSSIDVIELKLDLSEEEDNSRPSPADTNLPLPPGAHGGTNSFFEKGLEQSLDDRDRSRSISKSPDIDAENSHMYVRSAGFRGNKGLSPQNSFVETKARQPPTPPPRSASTEVMAAYSHLPDGSVQIPITHLDRQMPKSPRSPDDRIAFNPGYTRQYAGGPRPFPVPRNANAGNSGVATLPGHIAVNTRPANYAAPLHLVSPTSSGHSMVSRIPVYQHRMPNHAMSQSNTTSPTSPPYSTQAFHTFGGRGRQNQAPPPIRMHPNTQRDFASGMYDNNMNSNLDFGPSAQPQHQGAHSTLPTRFVTQRPGLPQSISGGNKTFYVVGDTNRGAPQHNKVQFRQDPGQEDPNQKPVFL